MPNIDDDDFDDDDDYFDDDDDDDDDSFEGIRPNKMAQMLIEANNSPIPRAQSLWGMKDVEIKITPEALEIISNQVRILRICDMQN